MTVRAELIERFLRYVSIESQSDPGGTTLPTTPGQQRLAASLAGELRGLGLQDIVLDDHATVTARKPGTVPGAPSIAFVAHLDTVDVGISPEVRPEILRYEGADLCLNHGKDLWLRAAEHPELTPWVGADVIFSDGTSVLGADDKAAIAIVMTLLARLTPEDRHGDIHVAFVPDEEVGLRGAKALDLARLPCDFAYTIDAAELGEVVTETFNAASAEITFTGVTAHPMSAKGVMVNPLLMAHDFVSAFDRAETPERTEGREGYVWFQDLTANAAKAQLKAMVRDFDKEGFAARKRRLAEVAEEIAARYPTGRVEYRVTDTYGNIGDSLGEDRRCVDLLYAALAEAGVTPKPLAMRGGTDGSALSARGLPTPNFFTGGLNFHSPHECLPIPAFEASYAVAEAICRLSPRYSMRA